MTSLMTSYKFSSIRPEAEPRSYSIISKEVSLDQWQLLDSQPIKILSGCSAGSSLMDSVYGHLIDTALENESLILKA